MPRRLSYAEDDYPVLEATLGDPVVMQHIGGAESAETLRQRQTVQVVRFVNTCRLKSGGLRSEGEERWSAF